MPEASELGPSGLPSEQLLTLVGALRQAGLVVPPSALSDAGLAISLISLQSPTKLRAALHATLLKQAEGAQILDLLFDLIVLNRPIQPEPPPETRDSRRATRWGLPEAMSEALRAREQRGLELLQALMDQARAKGSGVDTGNPPRQLGEWGEALLAIDEQRQRLLAARLAAASDLRGLASVLQRGRFINLLMQAAMVGGSAPGGGGVGGGGLAQDLEQLQAALTQLSPEDQGLARDALAWRLSRLRANFREQIDSRLSAQRLGATGTLEGNRSFQGLSAQDLKQMRRSVERLAESVRERLARSQRVRRRGRFDVQRTLRGSLRSGGIPLHPRFRPKLPRKQRLVVLCDISDSVRNVSQLFLHFVATLQRALASTRCFLFVSQIAEVSEAFRQTRPKEAVARAFAGELLQLHESSNYGRAFRSFVRETLPSLHPRSTLIIIGDGRNNFNPPGDEALLRIRHSCRRMIWICPESRLAWGFGDSMMPRYAALCDHSYVVQTLDDLRRVVERAPGW